MPFSFRRAMCGALVAGALTLPAAAGAQFQIDTRGPYDNSVSGGGGIFAQTFTATGTAPVLNNFLFRVGDGSFMYRASLYAFNGARPTGSALYTSETRAAAATLTDELFFTGALSLTENSTYIALIQRSDAGSLSMGLAKAGPTDFSSVYAGGAFYIATAYDADPTHPSYGTNIFGQGSDLIFATNVTTAPEPASLALVATGLAGVFGSARRRRQARSI